MKVIHHLGSGQCGDWIIMFHFPYHLLQWNITFHEDVIKWKKCPRYWPFVRGIHRSPVNSPHKGQWRGALVFSLICAWTSGWVSTRDDGDLRRHRSHYDDTAVSQDGLLSSLKNNIYYKPPWIKSELRANSFWSLIAFQLSTIRKHSAHTVPK